MTSRRAVFVSFLFLLSVMFSVAIAQVSPGRLVIQLKDGRTVAGELIEATPAGVKIKPSPKTDVMEIEWAKISKMANGMTRESIVKQWQAEKPDLLCKLCNGTATTKCTTCDGVGIKPDQQTPCTQCSGSGNVGDCKTPKCKDGMIPCPDKCLKADSFTGPPDAEGKRWRTFRGKSGSNARWSDAHIGELVVMENGEPVNKGKCPTCDGTTFVKDPACNGTGKKPCKVCKGKGVLGPKCDACVQGKISCPECKGTGLRPPEAPPSQTPPSDAAPTEAPAPETPAPDAPAPAPETPKADAPTAGQGGPTP